MIRRIVKLTMAAGNADSFKEIFEESRHKIVNMPGCHSVDLLRHSSNENIFFTFSIWDSEDDLNAYRKSVLFGKTWKKTKALFGDKPEAWSTHLINGAKSGDGLS